jgi:hypothetical protein
VRALMRPSARPKDQLAAWVDRVRRSAELAALAARLPRAPEDRRQSFIESAAESAERLVSLPGLIGRIRRTPAARQDPG